MLFRSVIESEDYAADSDFDGQVDNFTDDNANGFDDTKESNPPSYPDFDNDQVPDYLDFDSENDGIPDFVEVHGNSADPDEDTNGNGWRDQDEGSSVFADQDGDNIPNVFDLDSDEDGISDLHEAGGNDSDSDGVVDAFTDDNSNGLHDLFETTPLPALDSDNDGAEDFLDLDSDNDAILDVIEAEIGRASCRERV